MVKVDKKTIEKWEKDLKITISNGNQKAGLIKSISLSPYCSCNHDAPCYKSGKCYALKMERLYKNVGVANLKNYYIFKKHPETFWHQVEEVSIMQRFFRWFVSGDVPSYDFFEGMIKLAKKCKKTDFLCFTKKYGIVNRYIESGGKIPKNLKIIFSFWGGFRDSNPYNLPVNEFICKTETPDPGWLTCGGNCQKCACYGLGCWKIKTGETMYIAEH